VKAAVLNQVGEDALELRDDVSTVEPGPAEVRIRMRASGICHSDLSAMDGTLPMLTPGVVGHEGAGEVVRVGSAVTDLAVGDHVVLALIPPCGACPSCLRGQPHLCVVHVAATFGAPRFRIGDRDGFGFAGCGTFAEEVMVPRAGAVRIDPEVPFDVAALVGCGVLTGVGAVLNTARLEPGATVAVIGCGGVGVSVIQGARLAGASCIVAVDPVTAKHDAARRFGATHATTPDGLAEVSRTVTGGEGFDYTFEVVGLPATIRSAWDAARRGGTVVVVGAGAADADVRFSAQELFMTERRLLGSFYGSGDVRRDYHRILALWRAGRLQLAEMISRRLPLAQVNDGVRALRAGENVIRQIVTYD
jgi:S-(hydroxymethyl)glutathione dehydrogenase / alcohol dehydrogenase